MASKTMSLSIIYFNNHANTFMPKHLIQFFKLVCSATEEDNPLIYDKGVKLLMNQTGLKQRGVIKNLDQLVKLGFLEKLSSGYSGKCSVYKIVMPEPCLPKKGCTVVHSQIEIRLHSDTGKVALEEQEGCTQIPERLHSGADNKPSLNPSKSEVKIKHTSPEEQFFNSVMAHTPYKIYWGWQIEKEFQVLLDHKELSIESIAWAIRYYFPKIESTKFQKEISTLKDVLKLILEAPQQVIEDFAKVQANKAREKRLEDSQKVEYPVNLIEKLARLGDTLSIKSRSSN
jgi:hypothetical protein